MTYNPKYHDTKPAVKISPSKEDRLPHVNALASRSPGPIYDDLRSPGRAPTFASSKRDLNFASEISSNYYIAHESPKLRDIKLYKTDRSAVDQPRAASQSPGPTTYQIKPNITTRTYSVMRTTGRKDLFSMRYLASASESPGVGTYSPAAMKTRRNFYSIPHSKRRLEPKMSEI
mmetsp:Transcript_7631/g.14421  ORF Transcript_7631/g.14421 Transcript_7631/m.14421 type:complete len:174 (-) Transcript_7631:13283-13804(-)